MVRRKLRSAKMELVATASLCVIASLALPSAAFAQDSQAPAEAAEEVSESDIVVTGTRLGTGFTAPTPTTVQTEEEIEAKATTNIAQVLLSTPSFQPSNTTSTNTINSQNPAGYFLNVRGLGPNRTLVLVNGRRHVPTTSSGLVDISVIPSALIGRVETVTGGASAAWGSDAVAGVVNLIFKENMKGFEGSVQSGISERGDSAEYRLTLGYGTGFAGGRGQFTIGGEIADSKGVENAGDRDWARRGELLITNPQRTATNGLPARLRVVDGQLSNATENGLILTGPLAGIEFQPGGGFQNFRYGTLVGPSFMVGGDGINTQQLAALEAPLSRKNVFAAIDYDLTSNVNAFVEGSWAKSRSDSDILPSFDLGSVTIQRDNAYLPEALRSRLPAGSSFRLGRIHYDFPEFRADVENESTRVLAGLRGTVSDWNWEAYYQQGTTDYTAFFRNNRVQNLYFQSVDAVRDPNGNIVCRSTLANPGNGCVPVNLFGAGSVSQQSLDYFLADQWLESEIGQNVASVSIDGEPFSTWAGPVGVAFGGDYRKESVVTVVDDLSAASRFQVGNPQPMQGSYTVREAFFEAAVPLARDLPFAQNLDLNGAVRLTDYSTSGTVWTWKLGTTWEPTDWIRLRATRSRDIRAPNLDELFTSRQLLFTNVIDRLSNNNQVSVRLISSGNPDLQPETADTVTAGLVLEPRFVRGLRASVDYYSIKLDGAVSLPAPQDIVNRCAGGSAEFCDMMVRDSSGTLVELQRGRVNLARLKTSGVDMELSYRRPLLEGMATLRGLATYVHELISDDGVVAIDRAGDVGSGIPHWRWTASALYERGPATFYLEGRYTDGGNYDNTFVEGRDIDDNKVDSFFFLNSSLQLTMVDDGSKRVSWFLGVNNLLDRRPPPNPNGVFLALPTNPTLYELVGRKYTTGIRFKF